MEAKQNPIVPHGLPQIDDQKLRVYQHPEKQQEDDQDELLPARPNAEAKEGAAPDDDDLENEVNL
jgi:hypothetical protein